MYLIIFALKGRRCDVKWADPTFLKQNFLSCHDKQLLHDESNNERKTTDSTRTKNSQEVAIQNNYYDNTTLKLSSSVS